jgi:hypothetical protein
MMKSQLTVLTMSERFGQNEYSYVPSQFVQYMYLGLYLILLSLKSLRILSSPASSIVWACTAFHFFTSVFKVSNSKQRSRLYQILSTYYKFFSKNCGPFKSREVWERKDRNKRQIKATATEWRDDRGKGAVKTRLTQ